jgi:RHS repeat-associated protein
MPQGTATAQVVTQYDPAGRRSRMTATGQSAVSYVYDDANRLASITQGALSVGFGYDPASRRTTLTLPNGVSVGYGYDDAGQLKSLGYTQSAPPPSTPTPLGSLAYNYDTAGQRSTQSGLVNGVVPTDLPGAMTGTTTYDAANRITAWNGTTLSSAWDANGSLLTDSNALGTGATTYTWNARNQLQSTTQNSITTSFAYDAVGRRQSKTVAPPNPTPMTTTTYVYDGLNPIQDATTTGGTATTGYMLTGLSIDEFFARTESTTTRSLLTDPLGSAVGLVTSGGVQTEYSYEPFGKTTPTGTASSNPFQFTGRERDGTGLYYLRARYYQLTFQRFISEDPMPGSNLYTYAYNNPCSVTDPLGLDPPQAAGSPNLDEGCVTDPRLPQNPQPVPDIGGSNTLSLYIPDLPSPLIQIIMNAELAGGHIQEVMNTVGLGGVAVVWDPNKIYIRGTVDFTTEAGRQLLQHELGHISQMQDPNWGGIADYRLRLFGGYALSHSWDQNRWERNASCRGGLPEFYNHRRRPN